MPPRTVEHRRRLADSGRQRAQRNPAHYARMSALAAERHRISLNADESRAMISMRKRGWTVEIIAEWIGVHRDVIRRELHQRGLGTGRWRIA
jgi:hypothetical protein